MKPGLSAPKFRGNLSCFARTKVSKNHVVWAKCHFGGLTSETGWGIWSSALRGAHSRSLRERTETYRVRRMSSGVTADEKKESQLPKRSVRMETSGTFSPVTI